MAPRNAWQSPCLTDARRSRDGGFSLIELLISLVVFAAISAGLVTAFTTYGTHSADPMIRAQALSIGQAYLDEILLKHYADPDGVGGEARSDFDDIADYADLDEAPTDQFGSSPGSLSAYSVSVRVGASPLGANIQRIQVTVSHPTGINLALAAHRANY